MHNAVQVYEPVFAEQLVERGFPNAMPAGESFQSRLFILCVVIDVSSRVFSEMFCEERQHICSCDALGVAVMSPECLVPAKFGGFAIDPEQIFQARVEVRISFHIEEKIAPIRFRQPSKATICSDRLEFELRTAALPPVVLKSRLRCQLCERFAREPWDTDCVVSQCS